METLPRDDVRLHIVADAMRRRLALVLVVAFVVTAAVGTYALRIAPQYTSSAKLLLRPIPGNALSPDSAKNGQQMTVAMETEAGLVNSPGVAELVGKELKSVVSAGSTSVSATVPPNTQIVQVQYTDSSAAKAQAGTQAYADAFLKFRAEQAKDNLDHQLEILGKQARTTAENLKKVAADAASSKPSADAAAQVQVYTNRLANLQDSIGQLESTNTDAGSIVTPAGLPEGRGGISPLFFIAFAALLGLGAGVSLAIWRERNDDRVRAASETTVAGMPFLSVLPTGHHEAGGVIDSGSADATLVDAYRRGRASLMVAAPSPAVVAVSAVDAAAHGPSVSRVTANLAISLSSAEHSVCVVDATLEGGEIAALLDVPSAPGLTEILLHQEGDVRSLPHNHGVTVLPGGRTPQRSRELYASPHFASILAALRDRFDYVLIAAPPASTPDGNEVALAADGVVVLLTDCRTTHAAVWDVVGRARQLGVTVFGAVALPRPKRLTRGPRADAHSVSERQGTAGSAGSDGTDGVVAWQPPRDPSSESLEPAVTPAPGMPVDR